MDTGNFDELLHRAEQLTAEIEGEVELPRVERNFRQLLEAGQQLWSRASTEPKESDVRASVLLGSKGYDLQKVSQQLENISTTKKVAAVETLAPTDIQGFLKNERENAILSIIEKVKKNTLEEADQRYWETLQKGWEDEKLKILNALVAPGQEVGELDISFETPVKKPPTTTITKMSPFSSIKPRLFSNVTLIDTKNITAMDAVETAYAKEVAKYVEQVVEGSIRPNLAHVFRNNVAREVVGEQIIVDMWDCVSEIIYNDFPFPTSGDAVSHRSKPGFQLSLIKKARQFLEKKFFDSVQGTIHGERQPKQSMRSALTIYNLIKNYLLTKASSWNTVTESTFGQNMLNTEDGLVDGLPVWSFIWHCLRAGSVEAAIEVAQKSSLSTMKQDFITVLQEYRQSEDRRLNPKNENLIRLQYKRSVRLSGDLYKRAVYCLLGNCDVTEAHSEVIDKVDDFLWLRLSQVKVTEFDTTLDRSDISLSSSPAIGISDSLTFTKLQYQLSEEYGETHFGAQEQPFTYFKVLFLTGQFESAIEFLFRVDRYRSHAVHIAILLNELNLLGVPGQHLNVPLISRQANDPQVFKRLNFARLIKTFVRKFELNNPVEALNYFYLLRNVRVVNNENLFITHVSQLVRETKEFDKLLGFMGEDGCRISGAVDRFYNDVSQIIDQVAVDCEDNGLFEEAVKLYDLGSNHTKVLQFLNKLLSTVVAERKVENSKRIRLEELAIKIAERYCAQGHNAPREIAQSFYLLLDFMTFFDYYHNQHYSDALDTISKLKVIPFRNADIQMFVTNFSDLSEEIRRNIPDILLATMNILFNQYKILRTTKPQSVEKFGVIGDQANKEQMCNEIREKARSLITYAGMIPYRMPGDTNARLVQLEVLMN